MMETTDANALQTLKDMVLDEGKLVTYLTVSKDLCIHINKSKLLLKKFAETIRNDEPNRQLNINYLLCGLTDRNKITVTVCPEDKLDELKTSFKVVHFYHVYSLSKGSPNNNSATYVSLTSYDDLILCPGIIKSQDSIKRSTEEVSNLRTQSEKSILSSKSEPTLKKVHKEVNTKTKTENGFKDTIVNTETSSNKEIKKETVTSPKEHSSNKQNKSASTKGIAGFFNKQNSNTKKNDKEIKPVVIQTKKEAVIEKMEVDEHVVIKKEVKKENGISDNKVLNQIKKTSKVDKKRKRVLRVSDSDSEEENNPFVAEEKQEILPESDDEIPPTPAANTPKITTGINNPRKKRKMVDKTYMSDDGYIITKREEVYESCSDSESKEQPPPKKIVKEEKLVVSPKTKPKASPQKKKKVSPPQKGKQATLMNFFQKK